MDDLIIEDNYNKWLENLNNLSEKELVSLNWKNIFQKFRNLLSSRLPDFETRINIFNFILKIITKDFVTSDSEIKSYFNDIIPILILYTTKIILIYVNLYNIYLNKIYFGFHKVIILQMYNWQNNLMIKLFHCIFIILFLLYIYTFLIIKLKILNFQIYHHINLFLLFYFYYCYFLYY